MAHGKYKKDRAVWRGGGEGRSRRENQTAKVQAHG